MAQQSSAPGPERRVFTRLPYRIPCEFTYAGSKLAGIVTDISARGIFVETSNRIPLGTELRFVLRDARGSFELVGRVMRERRSHPAARHVRASGLGIQLDVVPEPFFRLLVELGLG
jgi:PilZ domain